MYEYKVISDEIDYIEKQINKYANKGWKVKSFNLETLTNYRKNYDFTWTIVLLEREVKHD